MEELATRLKNLCESYDPFEYGDLFGGEDEEFIHKSFLCALSGAGLEDTKEWLKEIINEHDEDTSYRNEAQAILQAIV